MKKHKGMRPLDIVILLKILTKEKGEWLNKDLAHELGISASEVSESLNRSWLAGFLDETKKKLFRNALLEFLCHGLKYVFPQKPGELVKGIPTAHSAPIASSTFHSDEPYVWPYSQGTVRGQAVEPLYPSVPKATEQDPYLYDLLALCDMLRVGRAREAKFAAEKLTQLVKGVKV
jgi:predicted transcriptional regulator